jgi:hypothetical protein
MIVGMVSGTRHHLPTIGKNYTSFARLSNADVFARDSKFARGALKPTSRARRTVS